MAIDTQIHPLAEMMAAEPLDHLYRVVDELTKLGISLNAGTGPWIAGGCLIRAIVTKKWPIVSDIDVFVRQYDSTAVVAVERLAAEGMAFKRKLPLRQKLSNFLGTGGLVREVYDFPYRGLNFQFIIMNGEYSIVGDLLESFDLGISQSATDGKILITSGYFDTDLAGQTITCIKSNIGTNDRIRKFEIALAFRRYREPAPAYSIGGSY